MTEARRRETLPRSARVRSRKAFDRVFRERWRASDRWIILHVGRNDRDHTRLGISVGRRFGGAVQRNRIKRLIREAFRRIRHDLPPGIDCVVIPRPGTCPTVGELQDSIRSLARRLDQRT